MSVTPSLTFYQPKIQFDTAKIATAIVVAAIGCIVLGLLYGVVMHYAGAMAHGLTGFIQDPQGGRKPRGSILLMAILYGLWCILPVFGGFFTGMIVGKPVQQANRHPSTFLFFLLSLSLLGMAFLLSWFSWLWIGTQGDFSLTQAISNAWQHGTPSPGPQARTLGFIGKAGYFLEALAFFFCALPGFIPNKNKLAELCTTCSSPLSCISTSENSYYAHFRLPKDLPGFREKITKGEFSALGSLQPGDNGELGIRVFLPHCTTCPNVRLITIEETIDDAAGNPDREYFPQTQAIVEHAVISQATFDKLSKFLAKSAKIA